MKNRDCPLGRGICTEKLRPTFQPIGVAILFRSNLFPCNEFIPYDGVYYVSRKDCECSLFAFIGSWVHNTLTK